MPVGYQQPDARNQDQPADDRGDREPFVLLPGHFDRPKVDDLLLVRIGEPAVQQTRKAQDNQRNGNQVLPHEVDSSQAPLKSKTTASRVLVRRWSAWKSYSREIGRAHV